ncbi:hypothetical protein AGR1A_Cc50011 [Agrobacterium fabacearum CFBP 5771]|nr:hypothetical protein AGR1A_Cc50011 [Agrobacterium fabacearum CFBP 5771]
MHIWCVPRDIQSWLSLPTRRPDGTHGRDPACTPLRTIGSLNKLFLYHNFFTWTLIMA